MSRNVIFQENAVYKDVVQKQDKITVIEEDQDESYLDLDLEAEVDVTSGGDHRDVRSSEIIPSSPSHSQYEETSGHVEMERLETPPSYHLVRDRGRRESRPPKRFDDEEYYAETHYTTEDGEAVEPSDYREARMDQNWSEWSKAMAKK